MRPLSYFRCLLLLLKAVLILDGVNCFNIDWKYPLIIQNREEGRIIPSDFGASVKLVKEDSGAAWIIIGAPRGNSTVPAHQGIVEPGVIWECSLGHPKEKCRQLEMDPPGNQMEYNGRFERLKDRGSLGGPEGIALDGKNLVTCASRPEKRDLSNSTFYMHGVCYRRPRRDIFLPPPLSIPRPQLIPLEEPENEIGKVRRNGLAGFSVHIPRTGNEIVMGAPGLYRWRGSLIQYLSKDGGESFTKSFVSDPEKYDRNFIWDFNYLGYSVTSGYFMERSSIQYAAGAPRASNFLGKVVIFRFPDAEDKPLQILKEIRGMQTGSYFGASILALDVNGDGFDDLLVGAPRYSRHLIRSRGISIQPVDERYAENGDEGAVHLYLSKNGALVLENNFLHGRNRPKAQFGTAMTSVGDLNRDGYNDFAVSAPFQDNSGAVYIYHGSQTGRIISHAQVIKASEIHNGLSGFGFSLAGTEDIDNNGFNDIAIGSFNSSQTVILRSKPVVSVHGVIKSSLTKLPLDLKQFTIQSCVSFTGDYTSNNIRLGVHLHYDTNTRPSRVQLEFSDWTGPHSQQSTYMEYDVDVSKSRETCTSFHVRIISPLEYSGAPVVFLQDIYVPEQDGNAVSIRTMNIDSTGAFAISGENFSTFCKTCPSIKPTQFELKLPLAVNCGDDLICQSDLRLNLVFRDISPENGFLIGSSPSLVMDVELSNLKETAIAPAVLLSWGNLELKRIPEDCSLYTEERNTLTYKCQMGQLLEEGKSHSVPFEFDMSTLFVSEETIYQVEFNALVTTVSELIPSSETFKTVQLPLYASADPHIDGSRYLEPFNEQTLTPYIVFYQDFDIGLDGPSPISISKVVFDLPVNLTTSDTATVVNVRGIRDARQLFCQPTKGQFSNDARISDEDDYEDKDYEIGGLLPIDRDVSRKSNSSFVEKDRLLIHCNSPFVTCMEVTCQMEVLKDGATPFVSFIMDIESGVARNLMKTHKVSAIQVQSKGRLIISDGIKARLPISIKPDETEATTIIEKKGFKPVSKWVYILAIIVGLVVLICVFYCLYACGCFDKKKGGQKDEVDAAEMKPLNDENKPEPEEKSDESEKENRRRVYTNDSIDLIGPPEFIPVKPPIYERPEEVTTRPSSQELASSPTDTR